jgi:CMP-N,N'-diacetyllegionaminic acid synthase
MKNIAIITARSGSKGLCNKNIRMLGNKPLLAYTIEAALNSKMFEEVMVSTDTEEYAEISRKWGAEVPFLRSKKNAEDSASSWDTVSEVLHGYFEKGKEFDTFCLLQPTSPFRTEEDIIKAYSLYLKRNATAIVSVCEVEHALQWCNKLDNTCSLNGFVKRDDIRQRQKVDLYYRINGAIYISNVKTFAKDSFLYKDGAYAYIMSSIRSIDIDTELDFIYAETLLKYNKIQEETAI